MDFKIIENLVNKYFEGETSLQEEQTLKEFFQSDKIPEHLKMYQAQFNFFTSSKEENKTKNLDFEKKLENMIKNQDEKPSVRTLQVSRNNTRHLKNWSLRVAASILLFVGGWFVGNQYKSSSNQDKASTQFNMDNVQKEMQEMKQLLVMSMLKQSSASERIKGVSYADDMKQADGEILDALIETLNTDESSNVRLAAANALFTFKDKKKVRQALIISLKKQDDPAVQIALINMLIALKEKKAKDSIENFLDEQKMMPEPVKEKIRNELKQL